MVIYNQHFDDITTFFIICSVKIYFSYSSLACSIYTLPWHMTSVRMGRGIFCHTLISFVFLVKIYFYFWKKGKRSLINFFKLMLYVNDTLNSLSSIKLFFTPPPGWSNFPTLPRYINKHLSKCTFSKSLTHNYANLEEPCNQGIKYKQSLLISNNDWVCMKLPTLDA